MNQKSKRCALLPTKVSQAMEMALAQRGRFILGLDGMAASGKSRLAVSLCERYEGSVIHIDDFFLPFNKRDLDDSVPGPHIDKQHFQAQVLVRRSQIKEADRMMCLIAAHK